MVFETPINFVLSLFGKGSEQFEGYSSNHSAAAEYLTIAIQDFQDGKRYHGERETSNFLDETKAGLNNVSSRLGFTRHTNSGQRTRRLDEKRWSVGLYANHPLANSLLKDAKTREIALKKACKKQTNHVRGTDNWYRTMLVVEDRALDNILGPWLVIVLNALIACLLVEVFEVKLPEEALQQWDTVYSLVLKTSLAFLLVFRMNRCAVRYWEARGYWGHLAHLTRNLVGKLLMYGSHDIKNRDAAIQWGSIFCLASKYFIRSQKDYKEDEFAGFLDQNQVKRLEGANHAALLSASMCRFHLQKLFPVDENTPVGMAHLNVIRMQEIEDIVARMVEQVSGMEKIRSTPLPIVYVTHLRTFLFVYLMVMPYSWVTEWSWSTIALVAFTSFALLGIEAGSAEVEIPFSQHRPNHLAIDAYCLVILDSIMGLVVHDAHLYMQGEKESKGAPPKRGLGHGGFSIGGGSAISSSRSSSVPKFVESKRNISHLKPIASVESIASLEKNTDTDETEEVGSSKASSGNGSKDSRKDDDDDDEEMVVFEQV